MEKRNEKQTMSLQMVDVDHRKFAVELLSGNVSVNLTQLAKPFGQSKRPKEWLRTNEAKEYLETMSKGLKCPLAELVIVKKGGNPGLSGTWTIDRRIAVRFAQWLSPEFSIAVDDMILRLLTRQAVLADNFNGVEPVISGGKLWYNYLDVLESLGKSRKSGSVAARKRLFPQQFAKLFGRNFITPEFCNFLKTQSDAHQLKIDFIFANKAIGGQA